MPPPKLLLSVYPYGLGKFAERAAGSARMKRCKPISGCIVRESLPMANHLISTPTSMPPTLRWHGIFRAACAGFGARRYVSVCRPSSGRRQNRFAAQCLGHAPQARHLLQWIIATAERVASGFEREDFERHNQTDGNQGLNPKSKTGKNHDQARLLTLLNKFP